MLYAEVLTVLILGVDNRQTKGLWACGQPVQWPDHSPTHLSCSRPTGYDSPIETRCEAASGSSPLWSLMDPYGA